MVDSSTISSCIIVFGLCLTIVFSILYLIDIENNVKNSHYGEATIIVFGTAFIILIIKISIPANILNAYSKSKVTQSPQESIKSVLSLDSLGTVESRESKESLKTHMSQKSQV